MSDTTPLISADTWMSRAAAYELCALGFLFPTRVLAEALASGEFEESCREVMGNLELEAAPIDATCELLDSCCGVDVDELFHELRKTYTGLFIGEKLPPITPYVGLWATQQRGEEGVLFLTRDALEIERFLRRCGVGKNLAANQVNDPVDHVGTLCEFLKFLCLVKAQAVEASPGATIGEEDFETFRTTYVAPYAAWLAEELPSRTDCKFYQAMGLFIDALTRNR